MTAEELRRRARLARSVAGRRRRASEEVSVVVRVCGGSLDGIERLSQAAWFGRAANGFLDVTASRRAALDAGLDDLRRVAIRLDRDSIALFDEAHRLDRLADEIESASTPLAS